MFNPVKKKKPHPIQESSCDIHGDFYIYFLPICVILPWGHIPSETGFNLKHVHIPTIIITGKLLRVDIHILLTLVVNKTIRLNDSCECRSLSLHQPSFKQSLVVLYLAVYTDR
jgi:hypothetical protein